MVSKDISDEFRVGKVDEFELALLLGGLFNSIIQKGDKVSYSRDGEDWAIKLTYDGSVLEKVEAGSELKNDEITSIKRQIDNDLLVDSCQRVGRAVLFSLYPVEGYFRFDKLLQIIPAPGNAPRSKFLGAEHPFVIEYLFSASNNKSIHNARRERQAQDIALLFNVFLEGRISYIGIRPQYRWNLIHSATSNNWESQYLREGYSFSGFVEEIETMSSLNNIQQMKVVSLDECYLQSGIDGYRPLKMADSIPNLIRCYTLLPSSDRKLFLRSAFWYYHAQKVLSFSPSAYIVGMISAIETLLPKKDDNSTICEKCKRSLTSVTKRFSNFVNKLVNVPNGFNDALKKLYSLRSRLAHGDELLRIDEELRFILNPLTSKEMIILDHIPIITKNVMINWLVCRNSS